MDYYWCPKTNNVSCEHKAELRGTVANTATHEEQLYWFVVFIIIIIIIITIIIIWVTRIWVIC